MATTIIIIVFFTLGFILLFIVTAFNKIIKERNQMNEAWAIIDVFLKKRYDLIPSLVDIVKGYASYEKSALEEIIRIRSDAAQYQTIESKSIIETKLDKALVHLFGVVEKYPDLKANNSFLELQQQISEIENDLERARRYYNGTVRIYNTHIESFPANMIAVLFNFRKGSFFQNDYKEKTNISFQ
jgi:LemA protein